MRVMSHCGKISWFITAGNIITLTEQCAFYSAVVYTPVCACGILRVQ